MTRRPRPPTAPRGPIFNDQLPAEEHFLDHRRSAPLLGVVARIQAESPVVFPVHPRTRGRLARLIGAMPGMANLRLVEPLPYLDFV